MCSGLLLALGFLFGNIEILRTLVELEHSVELKRDDALHQILGREPSQFLEHRIEIFFNLLFVHDHLLQSVGKSEELLLDDAFSGRHQPLLEGLANHALDVIQATTFLDVNDTDRCSLLAGTACTTRTMGIYLDVVGQTIVDDVCQVIDIQSTCCHISGDKQLQMTGAELSHHQVALLLRKVAMQCVAVVTFVHQVLGYLLCLKFGATEDDAIDARIEIHNALQGSIFVLGMHKIIHVVHVGCTLILVADGDLYGIVHIVLCNLCNCLRYSGAKEHRSMLLGQVRKDGLDILLEAH